MSARTIIEAGTEVYPPYYVHKSGRRMMHSKGGFYSWERAEPEDRREVRNSALRQHADFTPGAIKAQTKRKPGDTNADGTLVMTHGPYPDEDSVPTKPHEVMWQGAPGEWWAAVPRSQMSGRGNRRQLHARRSAFESVQPQATDVCPVCAKPPVGSCRCSNRIMHTQESLSMGHGYRCANQHRWSYQTADGKVVVS